MKLITAEDILDEILKDRVTEDDLAAANDSIVRLAATYGVTEEKLSPSHLLKRYGVVLACRQCCLNLVGTDPTVQMSSNFGNSRQDDIYERKYKLYDAQVKDIVKELTEADFTGDSQERSGAWTKTINIARA